ncbi:hypothetical protein HXX76_013160 [Chlamydomonas incerta]|uniref:Uncharacterized protein n=1 Tax=Chlamydomonas incerta TaxID=51695 RepID=A0A835VUQ1_CHLIN|nr:hypothetical protein HXX76_013160 [Chlamydomonas incerta]|eukprot:KAG2426179.1 hypothetical protein HXX76_013160 [Chlamydomonas incerta]
MEDSDSEDFSVISVADALSAVSGSGAVDATARLLEQALEHGRLAEAVERRGLDVQRAASYCLFKLTEPCASPAAAAPAAQAVAPAAEPAGPTDDAESQQSSTVGAAAAAPAARAAAGLQQLLSVPRLRVLADVVPLVRVVVQVIEGLQSPEVLAAALDVFQCLVLPAPTGGARQHGRRHVAAVARVHRRCRELLAQGAAAAAAPAAGPDEAAAAAGFAADTAAGDVAFGGDAASSSIAGGQQPQEPSQQQQPGDGATLALALALALAALRFFTSPLADLPQLQPEQRAQLAAHTTALLRAQVDVGGSGSGTSSTVVATRGFGGCSRAAATEAAVQGGVGGGACRGEAAAAAAAPPTASNHGSSTDSVASASASAVRAGCMPVLCALLRAGSAAAGQMAAAAAGQAAAAAGLTHVQHMALDCLVHISSCCSRSADLLAQGPQTQLLAAGGAAALLPLTRVSGQVAQRVLQLLLWMAAAGPAAQQEVAAALAAACALCPEMQRQFVGAAGACASELQPQQQPQPQPQQHASAVVPVMAADVHLHLLLLLTAAVVEAQPSVAVSLLLPDWGGQPLVQAALACLLLGGSGSGMPPPVALVTAALRLLHLLLVRCGPPPQSSLPAAPEALLPALVRLGSEQGADGDRRQLVMGCVHVWVRDMTPREAACCLRVVLSSACAAACMDMVAEAVEQLGAVPGGSNSSHSTSNSSCGSAADHTETLHLAACLLDVAWLPAAADPAGGSAAEEAGGGAAEKAGAAAAEAAGSAADERPMLLLSGGAATAACGRLTGALVSSAWLRRLLLHPHTAAEADEGQSAGLAASAAASLALHTLHAAMAARSVVSQGGPGCSRAVEQQHVEPTIDEQAAKECLRAVVPFLLPPPSAAAVIDTGPAPPHGHRRTAQQALQLLVVLLAAAGSGGGGAAAADRLLRRVQQAAADCCSRGCPPGGVWRALLAAAAPLLRELLPPDVCAVLQLQAAAAGTGAAQREEAQEEEERDALTRWRAAVQAQGCYSFSLVLQLGVVLLSGISEQQREKQARQDPAVGYAACVSAFAVGLLQLPTGPSAAAEVTSAGWHVAAAAAADLLRPLAPQLPPPQLAVLVPALIRWAAAESPPLQVLLCLAVCVDNPHLHDEDAWPEVEERVAASLCGALTAALAHDAAAEGRSGQLLMKLACRWCLHLGHRRRQQQRQQQHGGGAAEGPATLAARSALGRLATGAIKTALSVAAPCQLEPDGGSSGRPSAATSAAAAAAPQQPDPLMITGLLTDCLSAVCDGALVALYGEVPSCGGRQQQQGAAGGGCGAAAAAEEVEEANDEPQLLPLLLEAVQQAREHLFGAAAVDSGVGGGVSGEGVSAAGDGAHHSDGAMAVQQQERYRGRLLRAVLCGADWAMWLMDKQHKAEGARLQQEVEQAKQTQEALRRRQQQEAELAKQAQEALRRRLQEAEQAKQAQEALRRRLQQEAEQAKQAQEALRRRLQEAEQAKQAQEALRRLQQQEAEQAKQAQEALRRRLQEAEQAKQAQEALRRRQQQEAEQAKQAQEALRRRLQQEAEQAKQAQEALRRRQQQKAEQAKQAQEALRRSLQQEAEQAQEALRRRLLQEAEQAQETQRRRLQQQAEQAQVAQRRLLQEKVTQLQSLLAAARSDEDKQAKAAAFLPACKSGDLAVDGRSGLHWAARKGHLDVVECLVAASADVNMADDEDGYTPLHLAASYGHMAVVQALLEAGADKDTRDSGGWSGLRWAACEGHLDVVECLVAAGADVDMADDMGKTPLHSAACWGHTAVVQALLKAGADKDARDSAGKTPEDCVENSNVKAMLMTPVSRPAMRRQRAG